MPFLAAALVGSLLAAPAASARDFKFKPFTELPGVCPQCEPPPADVLTFKDGRTVRGTIVAVNAAFYTLERFGEVRTAARDELQSVQWRQGSQPSGLDGFDQIVLNNGHVFTGTIVRDERGNRLLQSASVQQTYSVSASETAAVFKRGVEAK